MVQHGIVMEIVDKTTAKIKMTRHSACSSCGKCATTSESKDIIVEVDNSIGAQIGDRVEVSMETINILKAAYILYILPLISLLLGSIGSFYILSYMNVDGNVELLSAVIGISLMFIVFLILKSKDSKFKESREFIPVIIKRSEL